MATPPVEDEYNAFIEHVMNGETVREACKRVNRSWALIGRWIAWDDEHAARYARARAASAALWADRAVEAAEAATAESAPAERIRADVYKWRAKVADPKGYGERVEVEQSQAVAVLVRYVRAPLDAPRGGASAAVRVLDAPLDALPAADDTEHAPARARA